MADREGIDHRSGQCLGLTHWRSRLAIDANLKRVTDRIKTMIDGLTV